MEHVHELVEPSLPRFALAAALSPARHSPHRRHRAWCDALGGVDSASVALSSTRSGGSRRTPIVGLCRDRAPSGEVFGDHTRWRRQSSAGPSSASEVDPQQNGGAPGDQRDEPACAGWQPVPASKIAIAPVVLVDPWTENHEGDPRADREDANPEQHAADCRAAAAKIDEGRKTNGGRRGMERRNHTDVIPA